MLEGAGMDMSPTGVSPAQYFQALNGGPLVALPSHALARTYAMNAGDSGQIVEAGHPKCQDAANESEEDTHVFAKSTEREEQTSLSYKVGHSKVKPRPHGRWHAEEIDESTTPAGKQQQSEAMQFIAKYLPCHDCNSCKKKWSLGRCLQVEGQQAADDGHEGGKIAMMAHGAVGTHILVWCTKDKVFIRGVVTAFDKQSMRHTVSFKEGVLSFPLWTKGVLEDKPGLYIASHTGGMGFRRSEAGRGAVQTPKVGGLLEGSGDQSDPEADTYPQERITDIFTAGSGLSNQPASVLKHEGFSRGANVPLQDSSMRRSSGGGAKRSMSGSGNMLSSSHRVRKHTHEEDDNDYVQPTTVHQRRITQQEARDRSLFSAYSNLQGVHVHDDKDARDNGESDHLLSQYPHEWLTGEGASDEVSGNTLPLFPQAGWSGHQIGFQEDSLRHGRVLASDPMRASSHGEPEYDEEEDYNDANDDKGRMDQEVADSDGGAGSRKVKGDGGGVRNKGWQVGSRIVMDGLQKKDDGKGPNLSNSGQREGRAVAHHRSSHTFYFNPGLFNEDHHCPTSVPVSMLVPSTSLFSNLHYDDSLHANEHGLHASGPDQPTSPPLHPTHTAPMQQQTLSAPSQVRMQLQAVRIQEVNSPARLPVQQNAPQLHLQPVMVRHGGVAPTQAHFQQPLAAAYGGNTIVEAGEEEESSRRIPPMPTQPPVSGGPFMACDFAASSHSRQASGWNNTSGTIINRRL